MAHALICKSLTTVSDEVAASWTVQLVQSLLQLALESTRLGFVTPTAHASNFKITAELHDANAARLRCGKTDMHERFSRCGVGRELLQSDVRGLISPLDLTDSAASGLVSFSHRLADRLRSASKEQRLEKVPSETGLDGLCRLADRLGLALWPCREVQCHTRSASQARSSHQLPDEPRLLHARLPHHLRGR